MAWYHALHTAFNALAQRRREERQMADEMRFHLEMETRWLMSEKGIARRRGQMGRTARLRRRGSTQGRCPR
jgi:hypothetical protein